jgi:hypothetical protein
MTARWQRAGATALAVAGLALGGCGLVGFDVEQKIPPQEVQGSLLGEVLPLSFAFPLSIDIESQTKAQGTGPASSAALKSLELVIISPDGATFEFLDSITIKVSADGLEQKLVAKLDDVPAQPRIALTVVPGVDLLPYIRKGAQLTASATGRLPRQTVRFEGKVVVQVRV